MPVGLDVNEALPERPGLGNDPASRFHSEQRQGRTGKDHLPSSKSQVPPREAARQPAQGHGRSAHCPGLTRRADETIIDDDLQLIHHGYPAGTDPFLLGQDKTRVHPARGDQRNDGPPLLRQDIVVQLDHREDGLNRREVLLIGQWLARQIPRQSNRKLTFDGQPVESTMGGG